MRTRAGKKISGGPKLTTRVNPAVHTILPQDWDDSDWSIDPGGNLIVAADPELHNDQPETDELPDGVAVTL